jgi:hypothetical protein
MTGQDLWLALLGTAAMVDGLLAGASLDQSIEQLPARHRIGVRAYHAYSQASHMANGRFWLIPLGIGGAVLTLAAAIWATTLNLPVGRSFPVFLAGGLAVAQPCPRSRPAGSTGAWRPGTPASGTSPMTRPPWPRPSSGSSAGRRYEQACSSSHSPSPSGRLRSTALRCPRAELLHPDLGSSTADVAQVPPAAGRGCGPGRPPSMVQPHASPRS